MKICPFCGRSNIYGATACVVCGRYFEENQMAERDPLLQEREKTHGNFRNNAIFSQHLKAVFKGGMGMPQTAHGLVPEQREALDMIALKLSRILSGQANFKDHWDDIAGYAKLAAEACE